MTRNPLTVRGLTESAILAALVALLALAARYVPLIGAAAVFACPIPLTVVVSRHGFRTGALSALVAALIAAMIGGPITGLTIALTFAPMGLALGAAVRAKLPAGRTLLLVSAVATVSLVANLGITLAVSGVNPYTLSIEGMREGQQTTLDFYAKLGVDRAALEQQLGPMRQMIALMPRLIPILVVIGAVTMTYINFEVSRFVLRRVGHSLPALPPVTAWRIPALFVWLLPLSFVLQLWARSAPVPMSHLGQTLRRLPPDDVMAIMRGSATRLPLVESVALNLGYLAQITFLLMGLVVAWVLLERYDTPRWLRWMLILIAFTTPALGILLFFLGLADAVFELRARWRRPARMAEAS